MKTMSAHVEHFNRTAQESFVDDPEDLLFADLALFNRKLADGLVFHNAQRPHRRHGPRSPLQFVFLHQPECQRGWTHTALQISGATCTIARVWFSRDDRPTVNDCCSRPPPRTGSWAPSVIVSRAPMT